ncbi:hypothetical protein Tsubulata_051359 [Turnera subulata]|uniref:Uncharacterized protein n=1 Tax=Turnera subulata TaxID=218843 RepID=A0A9Q0JAC8_9ROSI|nr:hypothetical protein Tsubulata_051359 [Turnera subulata]
MKGNIVNLRTRIRLRSAADNIRANYQLRLGGGLDLHCCYLTQDASMGRGKWKTKGNWQDQCKQNTKAELK